LRVAIITSRLSPMVALPRPINRAHRSASARAVERVSEPSPVPSSQRQRPDFDDSMLIVDLKRSLAA
jgi:hypothetical protein